MAKSAEKETKTEKKKSPTLTFIKIAGIITLLVCACNRGREIRMEEDNLIPDVIPSSTATTSQPEGTLHTEVRKIVVFKHPQKNQK